jgi:hypothetical protein
MKTVDIPGGQAVLREKADIKVLHRQLVEAAYIPATSAMEKLPGDLEELEKFDLTTSSISRTEAQALFDLQSATIVAALASWTRSEPLPTMETVGDLDQDVYDTLSEATASLGNEIVSTESFDAPDPRSAEFKASPTTPSGDSTVALRADQEPQSTPAPRSDTPSTATAAPSQG